MVLFQVQTALVASRQVRVHRRLGYASIALAATMIVVGLRTAIESAASGASNHGCGGGARSPHRSMQSMVSVKGIVWLPWLSYFP